VKNEASQAPASASACRSPPIRLKRVALRVALRAFDAHIFVKRSSIGIASLRRLADDRVDASHAWLDWL